MADGIFSFFRDKKKGRTYEVADAYARAAIENLNALKIEFVQALPTTDIDTRTIYFVPAQDPATENYYEEYINTDGTTSGWELIGNTQVDLSQYYTKTETDTLLNLKADTSSLATVATSGDYTDLQNTPSIPSDADDIAYDNTDSGLTASNTQDAIDELTGDLADKADVSSLATVATSGDYTDLNNTPTIPAAQVNSDWNSSSGVSEILNKPDLTPLPYLENVAWYDETHEFDTSLIYQKGNTCIYNEKLYRCDVAQTTQGSFVPLEWREVNARTLAGDYSNLWDIADQLDTGKQDKLTAGQNISIDANNEISATDTKPSGFFDYYSTDLPNKSSSSSSTTWSEFGRFSIAKGYWIITVAILYPKKAGGGRSVGLVCNTSNTETTTAPGGSTSQTVGSSGADVETNVVLTTTVNVTANGYIHIMGRQNSGGTISGTHYIRARGIKLM